MSLILILSFIVTMAISLAIVPIVIQVGKKLNIVAKKNRRTVHKHEIVRIGGYAIYISFIIGAVIFLKTDVQINAILIGGFLVFSIGLFDDIYDLSPKIKFLTEIVAALIVIVYGGIYLRGFEFGINGPPIIPGIITVLWIVGITNAINFMDGLDGLSAGISLIVLVTISLTSLTTGRTDIASLSLILAGAIMGFLIFNFHPAKIFMGDSGSLFIGFMIAVISLLGFGYNIQTFFTLGAPIVVLMVPIMDTLIAIVRRTLGKKKIYIADRKHLHHNLMFRLRLGQTKSVLVLYLATILFSLTSFLYLADPALGIAMFIVLMFSFQLFIEMTGMIGRKYKPLLTFANIFIKSEKLPKIRPLEKYRKNRTPAKKLRDRVIIIGVVTVFFMGTAYYLMKDQMVVSPQAEEEKENPYVKSDIPYPYLESIYNQLERAHLNSQKELECTLVSAYFICDFLSLRYYEEDGIGGMAYVYPDIQSDLLQSVAETHANTRNLYSNLEVESYDIISSSPTRLRPIPDKEDNPHYSVLISYTYNQDVSEAGLSTTANIILMEEENRYYVVSYDALYDAS